MKKWMYNALIVLFAAVFLISGGFLVDYMVKSGQEAKNYEDLGQLKDNAPTSPRPTIDSSGEVILPDAPPELVEVTDPETGETVKVLPEFKELYLKNNDIVGWIEIPGTDINYPVMQTLEEKDFYLNHNFEKADSKHGCIYAQENCDITKPSGNIVLYGHRMRDRSMFAQLDQFEKKSFWEENSYIYFDTLTELHTYKIISVFVTVAIEGKGFPYHTYVDLEDEDSFNTFVQACKGYSLFDTNEETVFGDHFITLSTCDYTHNNGRLVIVAKRVA